MKEPCSIVVVGGGLAGLLAAIRLARDGHSIQVFERRRVLSDRGGGLMIRPNGTRHLDAWDLSKKFERVARVSTKSAMHSLLTGDLVDEQVMLTYSHYPNWVATRQGVQKVLFEEAQTTPGVSIKFEATVSDVRENPCAAVLSDGSVVKADLIVVADGVRSHLRQRILGASDRSPEPVVNGSITYQTNLPLDVTKSHPEISKLLTVEGAVDVWSDQGRHVVSGAGTDVYMADFIVNESASGANKDENKGLWDEVGDIHHVRQVYHDIAPQLQTWLSTVDKCSRWTLCYLPDLPRWRSEHGTAILLGDAAHAMLPSAAQGLSQIIEDIAALSYLLKPTDHHQKMLLKTTKDISSVEAITRVWQEFRMPRVERIKVLAGSTQNKFQSKPGEEIQKEKAPSQSDPQGSSRDAREAQSAMNADFKSPAFLKWQYDYDLVKELEDFLQAS